MPTAEDFNPTLPFEDYAEFQAGYESGRFRVGMALDLRARDGEHDSTPRGWAETSARITNNPRCMDVAAWLAAQGG